MYSNRAGSLHLSLALLLFSTSLQAIDVEDTRLLSDPAVSANHVAFTYANDLWIARLDGSDVRRLTSHPGEEHSPCISPDGTVVAFTGEYDGNEDVFVVPASGGVPTRLTWHPEADNALGFTPDGTSVLFTSRRDVHTRRFSQLFTVPVGGGPATKHPLPTAWDAAFSPDGRQLAYMPVYEAFRQWKNYRGGTMGRIVIFDNETLASTSIPKPDGGSNDTAPMWMGNAIYFLSDRNGEFNLFSFDPKTSRIEQLTTHTDFPVLSASAGAGHIVYEQAGYLHLLSPSTRETRRLKIGIAAELPELRSRWAKGTNYVRHSTISPSGARAAFEFRGEIVTVPGEKGDPRNLTNSVAVHERWPAWSPDGKSIAYLSDVSGEYELVVAPQDGKGATKRLTLAGNGFYFDPKWSPDGRMISYVDNSQSIYVIDIATGTAHSISSNAIYAPEGLATLHHSWSPDSKWLAYTRSGTNQVNVIHLWSVEEKTSWPLTDGMADAYDPVFDASGKYLFFAVSTNAGPVQDWFSQSNADMHATSSLYLAVLAKGVTSPLAKESDEEKSEDAAKSSDKKKDSDKTETVKVKIDFDGLSDRIQALPIEPAVLRRLQVGGEGVLFFMKSNSASSRYDTGAPHSLSRFDLEKRKDVTVLEELDDYSISADTKKVLVRTGESWSISDLGEKVDLSKNKLGMGSIEVRVDPPSEWAQIFDEVWRINRDYFYDPDMHGADWPAFKKKYAVFMSDVATRNDLNRVMRWMCSEVSVGHHRLGGGDSLTDTESIPGGLLGADFIIENGRYKVAKVYGGLNWNPDLRSPLTEPGVDVKAGSYLIAVDGRDLRAPENLYGRFEATAGKSVELTVSANADGSDSRTVSVVPIADERNLRNRDWVEGNLRRVTEATNGRVAYVYVPNTAGMGHEYFKRYFFPQMDRDAIIVDERYNGGGQVADYYIDLLRRPYISHWAMRYGEDLRTPAATIMGPKVMIIDEFAGSGGDLLPWMFRKFGLGPLVGMTTWGGLVGVLGFPELMDGGFATAPNIGIWTEDGFVVENVGVPPDIEVDQTPKDVIEGRDPQLEKAIEVVMKELEKNPPAKAQRPPFPVRTRE